MDAERPHKRGRTATAVDCEDWFQAGRPMVYVLNRGTLYYVGYTRKHIFARFQEHRDGSVPSTRDFFHSVSDFVVDRVMACNTEDEALKLEMDTVKEYASTHGASSVMGGPFVGAREDRERGLHQVIDHLDGNCFRCHKNLKWVCRCAVHPRPPSPPAAAAPPPPSPEEVKRSSSIVDDKLYGTYHAWKDLGSACIESSVSRRRLNFLEIYNDPVEVESLMRKRLHQLTHSRKFGYYGPMCACINWILCRPDEELVRSFEPELLKLIMAARDIPLEDHRQEK